MPKIRVEAQTEDLAEKLQFDPQQSLQTIVGNLDGVMANLEEFAETYKQYGAAPAFLDEAMQHIFAGYTLLATNVGNIV